MRSRDGVKTEYILKWIDPLLHWWLSKQFFPNIVWINKITGYYRQCIPRQFSILTLIWCLIWIGILELDFPAWETFSFNAVGESLVSLSVPLALAGMPWLMTGKYGEVTQDGNIIVQWNLTWTGQASMARRQCPSQQCKEDDSIQQPVSHYINYKLSFSLN